VGGAGGEGGREEAEEMLTDDEKRWMPAMARRRISLAAARVEARRGCERRG
jgi:hypothetical protein